MVGDMINLPNNAEMMDAIFAYYVISHTDTKGVIKILKQINRVLKSQGEVYLTLGFKDSWGFKENWPIIDENTKIRIEDGPDNNVPHFYADPQLIYELFSDFDILDVRQIEKRQKQLKELQQEDKVSKTYVMVTGPAASGKSELCKAVSNNLSAQFYKPAHAYFELAKKYNIPNERVFFDINPNEAIAHFCNVCKAYELVIGDQHLAIQHKRDSALATNHITEIDISEPYVSALDYSLFDKLSDVEVKTLLIYLKANHLCLLVEELELLHWWDLLKLLIKLELNLHLYMAQEQVMIQ